MTHFGQYVHTIVLPDITELPGSALAQLAAPRIAATELHRLATAVADWAIVARESAAAFETSEQNNADHLGRQ